MKVEQISVFLENKPGSLAEVTRILGESGVNIRALSLADTKDFGILRLIVNDNEKAREILGRRGLTVRKTEVVAVEVPDRPGGLAEILKVLSEKRRNGQLADLQPDAKSQVTVRYVGGKPVGCTKVVVSTQHKAQSRNGKKYTPGLIKDMIGDAVESALPKGWMPKKPSDFLVNPTGNFVIGGPDGDCGLTGRKIIVDTYGGYAPHGGGAFSGKDPTKVDRSAAYAARYLAKNVVAAGVADKCTIQVAYAIGVADPMSVLVDTHGTGKVAEKKLEKVLPELFRLTPTNIRRTLKLNRPIYRRTAAYGHFGRAPEKDGGFSWEKTDLAAAIKSAVK